MSIRRNSPAREDAHASKLPRRLTRRSLPRDTVALARALIGVTLIHELPSGPVGVRVVETEAYPVGDAAGLSFRGRTKRNSPLFQDFGRIHVYLNYGTSWLINIASETEGVGAGVLFRAGEPVFGIEEMKRRRDKTRLVDLASGPGKLCQALGVDKRQDDGDFFSAGDVWLGEPTQAVGEIGVSVRIGISKDIDRPLRFYERANPHVSGPKRGLVQAG